MLDLTSVGDQHKCWTWPYMAKLATGTCDGPDLGRRPTHVLDLVINGSRLEHTENEIHSEADKETEGEQCETAIHVLMRCAFHLGVVLLLLSA